MCYHDKLWDMEGPCDFANRRMSYFRIICETFGISKKVMFIMRFIYDINVGKII